MFPAKRLTNELICNAKVLSSRLDILPFLPKGGIYCEVGVAFGDFSAEFLKVCEPAKFFAIDLFNLEQYPKTLGYERLNGNPHLVFYKQRFNDRISDGTVKLLIGNSTNCLELMDDKSIDVFYVDAWHSYEAVSSELSLIKDKIKPDGWIILNDYTMCDVTCHFEYGVVQAVNEFMVEEGWKMVFLALDPLMFCDVALKKI